MCRAEFCWYCVCRKVTVCKMFAVCTKVVATVTCDRCRNPKLRGKQNVKNYDKAGKFLREVTKDESKREWFDYLFKSVGTKDVRYEKSC